MTTLYESYVAEPERCDIEKINRRENIVILVLSIKGKIISFETNSVTVKELAEVRPREQGTYGGKATSILRHWPLFNFGLHHFGM